MKNSLICWVSSLKAYTIPRTQSVPCMLPSVSRDLPVPEHRCWAAFLQLSENQSCKKSCQRAAHPYNYFLLELQHALLNCSVLSCPFEICATVLPPCSRICHRLDRGGANSRVVPGVICPRIQGGLPTQALSALIFTCKGTASSRKKTPWGTLTERYF